MKSIKSSIVELFVEDSFLKEKDFSMTSLAPLIVRWVMHWQGIRSDPSVTQLVRVLFGPSYSLLCAGAGPVLLATRVADWLAAPPSETTLASMLSDRTLFFDKALTRALESIEQVVILGAGFDTRLFMLRQNQGLDLFEVDRIETQAVKKQALEKCGINFDEVHFVAVNFADEDWMQVLISNGFNPEKRTFFLWEGVTYYLTKAEVEKGFAVIDECCGDGSAIAFDFFSEALVTGKGAASLGTAALDLIGEPLRFGLDVSEGVRAGLADIIADTGLVLDELQTIDTWIGEKSRPAFGSISRHVLGGFAIFRKNRK